MPARQQEPDQIRQRLRRAWSRFWRDEGGSASIEFVLWVPMLTYIGAAMFVLSYYMATASEVQQVANELVRATISRIGVDQSNTQICGDLEEKVLPRVMQTMSLLRANRLQPFAATGCQRDSQDFLYLTITYDLTGTGLHNLSKMLGFTLTSITRRSVVQL